MAEEGARFQNYVREAMREQGLTVAELGRRSEIDPAVIYSWFRGEKQPRRTTLRPIAEQIGRTPDELLAVWDGARPNRGARTTAPDPVLAALERQTLILERLLAAIAPESELLPDPVNQQEGRVLEARTKLSRDQADRPRSSRVRP